ncbi:MAG: dihydroneopterin aldolase [Alphaproteobacteria bacterium]|nr:dihydroneopterin aldolase [Alphaproteobacteria bacterium]
MTAEHTYTFNPGLRKTFVEGLVAEVKIGIYPHEHLAAQKIGAAAELWSRNEGAAPSPNSPYDLPYIDYDLVRNLVIKEWPMRPHVDLLESLADELLRTCLSHPDVMAARIKVYKLELDSTARAGVELFGTKDVG